MAETHCAQRTINLSATGSKNAPNGVSRLSRRARKPSSQSVAAARAKTAADHARLGRAGERTR